MFSCKWILLSPLKRVGVITYFIKGILILPKNFFFTWRGNIHIIFTSSIQWNHHHSSPTINQYKQPLDKLIIKNRRRYIWVKLFIQHLPQKTDCVVVVMQHVNAQVAVCIILYIWQRCCYHHKVFGWLTFINDLCIHNWHFFSQYNGRDKYTLSSRWHLV